MRTYFTPINVLVLLSGCQASKNLFGEWNPWDKEVRLVERMEDYKGIFHVYVHDPQRKCWVDFYGREGTIDAFPSLDNRLQETMEDLLEEHCPQDYSWEVAK